MREMAILLGLMCKHSCEECVLIAYGVNDQRVIELEKGTILDNMKSVTAYAKVIEKLTLNLTALLLNLSGKFYEFYISKN